MGKGAFLFLQGFEAIGLLCLVFLMFIGVVTFVAFIFRFIDTVTDTDTKTEFPGESFFRRRKIKKLFARDKKHKLSFHDYKYLSYLCHEEVEYLQSQKKYVPLESKKFFLIEKNITSYRKKYNDINERIKHIQKTFES